MFKQKQTPVGVLRIKVLVKFENIMEMNNILTMMKISKSFDY